MKTKLIILLITIGCIACDDDNNSFDLTAVQDFYLLNKDGNDLLNPNVENTFNTNRIKIYYLIDGEKVQSYTSNYFIKPSEVTGSNGRYFIRVFLNEKTSEGDTAYTFIEWNETDIDTIRSQVRSTPTSLTSYMFAFNDSVFPIATNYRVFEIIK